MMHPIEAKARAEIETKRLAEVTDDLRTVMGSRAGRSVLRWLLWERGKVECVRDNEAIKDGIAAAMHGERFAGRQDLALDLMAVAKRADFGAYRQMSDERLANEEADAYAIRDRVMTDQHSRKGDL